MWPFLSHALFPPPTEAWLQRAASDSEAQGWGAWSWTEKTSLARGCGDRKEEETREEEDNEEDEEDASFSLSLLESEDLAEHPVADQELESIKRKLQAMEQAQGPEPPGAQGPARKEEGSGAMLARQLLSPETDGLRAAAGKGPLTGSVGLAGSSCPCPGTPVEKMEVDHRSIYVGNVDYGGTAKELEAYFNHCGEVQRVTILCDKFSGHPKGYAYVEFASESSVQAAVELDESIFRGRVIKVLPKRTNLPGISSTDRGGLRKYPGTRGAPFARSSLQGGVRFRPQGRNRGRGRVSLWYSPY